MKCVLLLLLAGMAVAQTPIANPGFEQGSIGAVPTGWMSTVPAFTSKVVDQNCHGGIRCAEIDGSADAPPNTFGNLMQMLPAAGYINHRVVMRGAVRVEGPNTLSRMWLRVDRAGGGVIFIDNMQQNPITSPEWKTYTVSADVPSDAGQLAFGFMLFGPGKAWVDDAALEIMGAIHQDKVEPPHPLTAQGLTNLTAFARLYGWVRFFHPSDQAAAADWETFAIEGVRAVEPAATPAELQATLNKLFAPIAPLVRVYPSANRPAPPAFPRAPEMIRYEHHGVGLSNAVMAQPTYHSDRVRIPTSADARVEVYGQVIAPGISADVPVLIYADSEGTLPHLPKPAAPEIWQRSANDRATRLADIVIAWNIFQHFYPYFPVVKTDWPAELANGLRSAATDQGTADFEKTLSRLVAALHDGHGNVGALPSRQILSAPVVLDFVEGQLTVTRAPGSPQGIRPGDRVLKIDGKPIAQAVADARALISAATPQWLEYRTASVLNLCGPTNHIALELEPFSSPGTTKAADLACGTRQPKARETYTEPRPEKIAELEPGILYVDLDRLTDADWNPLVPRLEQAKGIIFDMRGYPAQPAISALQHLTGDTIRSAKWNVPLVTGPDQVNMKFTESGWELTPAKPRFAAPTAFITDGRAISYAETIMGIVENFKLGAIVGGPTAGTNGNVNPFKLPGGFTLTWTGMKVLKHDGSQHHGIGIRPTIPASRTRQGVAEEKDELLLRALQAVKAR